MFQRTPKSSPVAERSPRRDFGDQVRERVEQLLEWRDAAGRVTCDHKAWCAAGRRDRQRCYVLLPDALAREERAARQLHGNQSALGADSAAG